MPPVVLRRCVSCRQLFDRTMLLRVIRQPDGLIVHDRGMGRSAYLCANRSCLEEAQRRKRLQRALRCQVPDAVFAVLDQRLNAALAAPAEAR